MRKAYFNGVDKVVSRETFSKEQRKKNQEKRFRLNSIFFNLFSIYPCILTTPKYHLAKLH